MMEWRFHKTGAAYFLTKKLIAMKKTFTFLLIAVLGMLSSVSAAEYNQVTLKNNSSYEVSIDGRIYTGNNTYNISDLAAGNHLVSVYQVSSGGIFSRKTRNLISSKQFISGSSSVDISVNQSGQIYIGRNQNRRNDNNGGTWNNDGDRRYGKSEGKGNGNKYGQYKNKEKKSCDKKDRKEDRKYDRRSDDDRDD